MAEVGPVGEQMAQDGPLAEVSALYNATPRALAFRARTRAEMTPWKASLRAKLAEILNVPRDGRAPVAEVVERVGAEGHSRELVLLRTTTGTVPVYVLRPDGPGPFRPVLALHGHGAGVRLLVGAAEGTEERDQVDRHNTAFGLSLVERGFLVFAPEALGFGSRREEDDAALGPLASSCRQASLDLLLLGHTMAGLRVRDAIRTLAYIQSHPDARREGIGGVGFSGGGTTLLYTAALDERISTLVLSGCLASYRQSIMADTHCEDNYLPGILLHAEVADIAALLAPRPLFAESGLDDPEFPASSTVATITQVRKAYTLLGANDRLELEVFAGGHRFHGARSLDWLARRL